MYRQLNYRSWSYNSRKSQNFSFINTAILQKESVDPLAIVIMHSRICSFRTSRTQQTRNFENVIRRPAPFGSHDQGKGIPGTSHDFIGTVQEILVAKGGLQPQSISKQGLSFFRKLCQAAVVDFLSNVLSLFPPRGPKRLLKA